MNSSNILLIFSSIGLADLEGVAAVLAGVTGIVAGEDGVLCCPDRGVAGVGFSGDLFAPAGSVTVTLI